MTGFLQTAISSIVVAAIVTGIWQIINAFIARRVRTPGDDQARVELGVEILQKQIESKDRDAARWIEIEKYLRTRLDLADQKDDQQEAEIRKLNGLLEVASGQLRDIKNERDDLRQRITMLARKHTRGEQITLGDILGNTIADLEDTITNT